jgi:hypothetical protein
MVEDMRRQLAAYQQRVDQAHAMGLAALGFGQAADQLFASSAKAVENMGGITVQGDTHQYFGGLPAVQTQPVVQQPTQSSGLKKYLLPTLLGAALAGGGAGGYMLYDYYNNQPVVQQPGDPGDWKLDVEVVDP